MKRIDVPRVLAWLEQLNWRFVAASVLGAGVVFRIAQYLFNRSLWFDEVYPALQVIHGSFPELVRPLEENRGGSPVGFLVLEKIAVLVGGTSEYVLRFFPLVSGVAALLLFYLIAREFFTKWNLVFAITLFAASDPLIYYSSELKQYSFDVLIALLISYFVLRARRSNLARTNLFLLALVGCSAVWFSDPVVFVLAGAGGALALASRHQPVPKLIALAAIFFLWIATFAVNYFVHLGNLTGNAVLQGVWEEYFLPLSPGAINWIPSVVQKATGFLIPSTSGLLTSLILILGLVAAYYKKILVFLVSPIIIALLASALHLYPFYQRFMLFAIPSLILLLTFGFDYLFHLPSMQNARPVVLFLAALVLLPQVFGAISALIQPRTHEEIKPVVQYLLNHRDKNDSVYVYYAAAKPFDYYNEQLRANIPYTLGKISRENWMGYLDEMSKLRVKGRVWFLFSHVLKSEGVDEEKLFLQYLLSAGRQLDSFQRDGASIYLFDLG